MSVHGNRNTIYNTVQRGRPQRGHSTLAGVLRLFSKALLYFNLRKHKKHAKETFIIG